MGKQKILISRWIPADCRAPYEEEFALTLPESEDVDFSYAQILELIPEYDAYFEIDMPADRPVFDAARKLRVIANFGVGYDKIDWKYATELGIPVLNTPLYVTEATAELSIALMLSVMRGIPRYDKEVRLGRWDSPLFSDRNTQISGSTLGIIGFGRIGRAVCRKAKGLGMNVVYYDQCRAPVDIEADYEATYLAFDEVLAVSDCVSLHTPYFPENHHLFHAGTFKKMKPTAYFINAARGKLVDERALCSALQNGMLKGAGLDVYEEEPAVYPGLLALDNVVLTPHVASLTMRSRIAMCHEALAGIVAVLHGEFPQNVVNPTVFSKQRVNP